MSSLLDGVGKLPPKLEQWDTVPCNVDDVRVISATIQIGPTNNNGQIPILFLWLTKHFHLNLQGKTREIIGNTESRKTYREKHEKLMEIESPVKPTGKTRAIITNRAYHKTYRENTNNYRK